MKRIYSLCLLILPILFLGSCRENLMDLQHVTGDLSVTVSINKSLYQGEYIQDGAGRFVGPSSDSIALTYTVGDQEYTSSLQLELSVDGNHLTGTASLENLPAGVEGMVNVSTFDVGGKILCEGEEVMVLSSGSNQVTLTLGISDDCPFLTIAGAAEFLDEALAPGSTFFIKLPGLTGGARYDMHIYQEIDSPDPPEMAVITDGGTVLDIEELDTDNGGISFILPTGEDTAVICFYNPYSYVIPGLLWIDEPETFNQVILNTNYDDYLSWDGNPEYINMTAGIGKLFATDQAQSFSVADLGGLKYSTNDGIAWSNIPLTQDLLGGSLDYSAQVTDLVYKNGVVYTLIYQYVNPSTPPPPPTQFGIAIYNPSSGVVEQTFTLWEEQNLVNGGSVENLKVSVSDSTIFIAYLTAGNSLELYAGSSYAGPDLGNLVVSGFSSSATTINELQVCSVDEDLYIYADATIYRWTAGSTILDEVFTLSGGTEENFRNLSVFNNRYIVASNGAYASLYLPDIDKSFSLFEYSDLLTYIDPNIYSIKQTTVASENYFMYLTIVRNLGDSSLVSMTLDVLGNGGFQSIGRATMISNLPVSDYIPKQILFDESNNTIYLNGIHSPEGTAGSIYSFFIQ